jgi:hypothetical protein
VLRMHQRGSCFLTTYVADSSNQKGHSEVALALSQCFLHGYVDRASIRTLVCCQRPFLLLLLLLSFLIFTQSSRPTTWFFKLDPKLLFLFYLVPVLLVMIFFFEIIHWLGFFFISSWFNFFLFFFALQNFQNLYFFTRFNSSIFNWFGFEFLG